MGGGVSWISTSTSLSMAWSLGLRPGTGAREEGACRRGREWERRVRGVALYFFLLEHSGRGWASGHSKTEHLDLTSYRRLSNISRWKNLKRESPVCSSITSSECYRRRQGRALMSRWSFRATWSFVFCIQSSCCRVEDFTRCCWHHHSSPLQLKLHMSEVSWKNRSISQT